MSFFSNLFAWFKNYFWVVISFFIFLVICLFIVFPFGDLSDLVGTKVAELSQNRLFLQFANLQISAWPPGVKFNSVNLDTASLGPFEADELTVSPAITTLLNKIPGGEVFAHGLFRGDVQVSMGSGTKTESGLERQHFQVHANHLNLAELQDVLQLPVSLSGQLSLEATSQVDLSFTEQPDADFEIRADKFEFPSQILNSMMGPISVPDLKLSTVDMKGHMSAGKIFIEEANLGKDSDDIHGKIKGDLALNINSKLGFMPQMGAYNFDVDLVIKSSLEDRLSLFLAMVSNTKTATTEGGHYHFRVNGQNPYTPPAITALH